MVRWLLWLGLGACVDAPCEGSMLDGPAGLVVVASEHPTGWADAQCAACHVPAVTHIRDCTPGVDLAAVRREVQADPQGSCVGCHGDNGVDGVAP